MAVLYSACLCKPLCFVDEMQILLRIPLLPDDPGGGNGNPLQYSCLENPMGREAWRATVHGVTKSQTCLSTLSCFFLLGNIFVKAKRKYINKCTWGVIALGFCSLSWHLKPIGLEKKKKAWTIVTQDVMLIDLCFSCCMLLNGNGPVTCLKTAPCIPHRFIGLVTFIDFVSPSTNSG